MKASYIVRLITILALCSLVSSEVRAQGQLGFGLIFGEPTGIAWKYRMNQVNAVDGGIGFSPFDRFRIHLDYLWHSHPFDEQRLSLHYGVGPAIGFGRTDYFAIDRGGAYVLRSQELGFGARTVVGLTYMIPRSPIDLFLEMAPVFVVSPNAGLGFDVGLGMRAYP